MLADFLAGGHRQPNFVYPSAVDAFKRQFAHLEAGGRGQHSALGQATRCVQGERGGGRLQSACVLAHLVAGGRGQHSALGQAARRV